MFTSGTILVGKYELLEVVGQGGMATVWRAQSNHARGSSSVAIKVMLQRLCNDPHFVELFIEEARVSSRLQHSNVVQIFDFGEDEGIYFLVMEWVDGLDLLDYARSFTEHNYFMPWAALAIIAIEVLKGLHSAHHLLDESGRSSPIFHRDVTPHNILLGINGAVKLTDFGLAKATDRGSMTLPHVLKGKISYTAPEMTRGVKANARTDIFSLGVTLWEALAGRKMFDATSPLQVVKQIQAWSVPALRDLRPDLPVELVGIVERAIARDPEQRFGSAQEFASALSHLLPPLPDMQRLGKSVADARLRIQQAKQPEDLRHLKESLRPSLSPSAPTLRSTSPDGRAARAPRATPPPLRSPSPEGPPVGKRPPPIPVRLPPTLPPVQILEKSVDTIVLDDLPDLSIELKPADASIILDDLSDLSIELITPDSSPPPSPVLKQSAIPQKGDSPSKNRQPPTLPPTPPSSPPRPLSQPPQYEELDVSLELELPTFSIPPPASVRPGPREPTGKK